MAGEADCAAFAAGFEPQVFRWGRAVLKVADCWLRRDRQALLMEGVVVEFSRPLHPLVVVSLHPGGTSIRLWPHAEVERTPAVQRLLAIIARQLQRSGVGAVTGCNLGDEVVGDLGLEFADG
jgi:hypothetical protein